MMEGGAHTKVRLNDRGAVVPRHRKYLKSGRFRAILKQLGLSEGHPGDEGDAVHVRTKTWRHGRKAASSSPFPTCLRRSPRAMREADARKRAEDALVIALSFYTGEAG